MSRQPNRHLSYEVTVDANPGADDCLAEATQAYVGKHTDLRGWDLAPRFASDLREEVILTVPTWHRETARQ